MRFQYRRMMMRKSKKISQKKPKMRTKIRRTTPRLRKRSMKKLKKRPMMRKRTNE